MMKDRRKELESKYLEAKNKYEEALEGAVVEDLFEQRAYSDKHLYTYQEIADKYEISKNKVQQIAKKNNIIRRGDK